MLIQVKKYNELLTVTPRLDEAPEQTIARLRQTFDAPSILIDGEPYVDPNAEVPESVRVAEQEALAVEMLKDIAVIEKRPVEELVLPAEEEVIHQPEGDKQ